MKDLFVEKKDEKFLTEIKSEKFTHTTKRIFDTEEEFLEYLGTIKPIIHEYKLRVSEELWSLVVNFLSQEPLTEVDKLRSIATQRRHLLEELTGYMQLMDAALEKENIKEYEKLERDFNHLTKQLEYVVKRY